MLPKEKRIPRRLWGPLIESRNYSHSTFFTLKSAPSAQARVAVSVSKKVSKKAVVRNRVRRRAYAVIRELVGGLGENLYLISAKPGVDKLTSEELHRELATLLKKG